MKRNLFAIFLALALVVVLAFVIAPSAKAEINVVQVQQDGVFTYQDNIILDINGKNVEVEVPDGKTLFVINTSFMQTEDGKPDFSGTHAGSLTNTGSGNVAHISYDGEFRYLAVETAESSKTYTFHPFNMAFTHMGINTLAGENDDTVASCLRVAFIANDVARKALTEHGIYNVDTGATAPAAEKYPFVEGTNICCAYFDFMTSLDTNEIDNQRSVKAYVTIDNETVYTNFTLNFIPREVLKQINAGICLGEGEEGKITPTQTQASAIKTLMGTNIRVHNAFSCYWEGEGCKHGGYDGYICCDCGVDTTAFRMENGGFENGMDGWIKVGNIGDVSTDKNYWINDPERAEGFAFGMDGEKMFSAYAPGAAESAVGILTSPSFTIGGSGFVTFKVGAMKDGNYVYIDVVDANTKQILARYYNGDWQDVTDGVKSGCTLVAYKADLSAFKGKEVFFRISDNADSGYGLFFVDSFNTYYETEPEGFNAATPVSYAVSGTIYDLFNGGFEMGDVQGWWNIGEIGVVTNANGYWGDNIPYNKDGDYLFTGVESFGANTMREGNRGTLTSSVFEIGGTGWISFKLGGGGNALCYVQVIDAVTNEVLARYHQQAQQDAKLIQYVANLSAYIGKTARIQVVDQAENGWGCVSFDNVVTYYPESATLPEGITASDIKGSIKYTIDNGSFETGNLDGWTMNIIDAGTHSTLGWVLETEDEQTWYTKNDETKDGRFLFTFLKPSDVNCENSKGTLQSSTFSLKQGAFVAFKFGGAGASQNHDVYIELCRADGSVIARFYNDAPGKVNTKMNAYYYQYNGIEVDCYFRVVDNSTGDYGCFVVDDFRVNLESAPEGFIPAIQ